MKAKYLNINKNNLKPKSDRIIINKINKSNKKSNNNINVNKKNKSNIIFQRRNPGQNIIKTYTNLKDNSKYKNSSKTTPNLKNKYKNKKIREDNVFSTNSQNKINTNIKRKLKRDAINRQLYNNKLKLLDIRSYKSKDKFPKSSLSKGKYHKSVILSEEKDKKINKSINISYNTSCTFINLDKIKSKIDKIKYSEI